jgi:hypothetical protein
MSDAKGLVGRHVHADALDDSIETAGSLARDKRKKRGPRRAEGIKTRPGTGGRGDCLFVLSSAALPDDPEKGGLVSSIGSDPRRPRRRLSLKSTIHARARRRRESFDGKGFTVRSGDQRRGEDRTLVHCGGRGWRLGRTLITPISQPHPPTGRPSSPQPSSPRPSSPAPAQHPTPGEEGDQQERSNRVPLSRPAGGGGRGDRDEGLGGGPPGSAGAPPAS